MQHFLVTFSIRWLVSALGLWIAASLLGSSRLSVGEGFGTILGAGLFLALVNMALKPILVILSFPAIIFSLGLFMLVLNGFLILIAGWLGLLLFLRIPLRRLGLILLGFGVVAGLSWFVLKDYQRERILTFLDPGRDPLRSGYNIRQAIVAIGSGKLFGRGLGLGTQSQLNFLPTQDTDFIFAVFSEEFGFFGACLVIGAFLVIVLRGLNSADRCRNRFNSLIILGASAHFASHVLVNIGMATGMLPVTGLPLPFMSYGGSSLMLNLTIAGAMIGMSMRWKEY